MVTSKLPIVWSSDAVWRLNRIYEWYSNHESISRAKKVIISIKSTVRNIPQNPYIHIQCDEILVPNPNIRKALVAKTYWVIFEIEENRIVILDIIHSAINPIIYKNI